jgi:hypothetical protein
MAAEFVGIVKGAIDLSEQEERLANSTEIARLWVQDGGPGHFFINASKMPDARMFGMMITDTVRHAARAYACALGITEAQAAASIWRGVDEERERHTTELNTIDPGERIH